MDQAALAVPKDRQDVAVRLNDGATVEGSIFLEYMPGDPSMYHRVAAFLEDAAIFFPLSLKGGGTEFIQKKNINLVELRYCQYCHSQENLRDSLTLMHTIDITAVFLNGMTINGALMAEVPVEKARLSDILNLPEKFLSLKLENRVCYINKESLRKVVNG